MIKGVEPFPLIQMLSEELSNLHWHPCTEQYQLPTRYDISDAGTKDGANILSLIKAGDLISLKKIISDSDLSTLNGSKCNGIIPLFAAVMYNQPRIVEWLVSQRAYINQTDSNGNTAVMICSYLGHCSLLQTLLDSGANPHICDDVGRSALMVACQQANMPAIRILIENGADSHHKTDSGKSLLHYSTYKGQVEVLNEVQKHGQLNVNMPDNGGMTCLMICAYSGHFQMVEALCDMGVDIDVQDNEGRTALMAACQEENVKIADCLIRRGASVNKSSNDGKTALIYGALKHQSEVVKYLVNQVDDPNHETLTGETALMIASYAGDLTSVQLLLNNRNTALDDGNILGKTALMSAAEGGHLPVVKHLVESGSSVQIKSNSKFRAIHFALLNHHRDIADYFVKCGDKIPSDDPILACLIGDLEAVSSILRGTRDLNIKDEAGRTLLMAASQQGYNDIVLYLLGRGVDVNQQNNKGITALGYAVEGNHKLVQQTLLHQGAIIDYEDISGKSLLMKCAASNNIEKLKELDLLGADIFHRDSEGKTTLMIACENGNLEIVEYLAWHGSPIFSKCKKAMTAEQYAFCNDHKNVSNFLSSLTDLGENEIEKGQSLIKASEEENVEIVKDLLSGGANPNYVNPEDNETALIVASKKGNVEIIEALLLHNARVNYRNITTGRTSLFVAAFKGRTRAAVSLLEHGASANIPDRERRTVLMCAVQENRQNIIKALVKHGAFLNVRDQKGWSALTFGAKHSCVESVDILLKNDCLVDSIDHTGTTPLGDAAGRGVIEIVKLLLMNGANIDHQDYEGRTALIDAAQEGKIEIVKYLLKCGANVYLSSSKGTTALDMAGMNHHRELFDILQDAGSPMGPGITEQIAQAMGSSSHAEAIRYKLDKKNKILNAEDIERAAGYRGEQKFIVEQSMQSVLQTSAKVGSHDNQILVYSRKTSSAQDSPMNDHLTKVHWSKEHQPLLFRLCEEGFNATEKEEKELKKLECLINVPNADGILPIFHALQNQKSGVVDWLLDKGAQVNVQNNKGQSPLMIATMHEDIELLKILVNHDADIKKQDKDGSSAVHYASDDGPKQVIEYLLQNGAGKDQVNTKGITPLMIAARKGNTKVVDCLLGHGASVEVTDEQDNTALAHCAMGTSMKCADIINALCKHGTQVDTSNKNGDTPLLLSVTAGNIAVTQELVSRGANLNHANNTRDSFVMEACRHESLALVRMVIDHIDKIHPETLLSALEFLITNICIDLLDIFMQNYICVEIYKENEEHFLNLLAAHSNFEVLEYLAKQGKIQENELEYVVGKHLSLSSTQQEENVYNLVNSVLKTKDGNGSNLRRVVLDNSGYHCMDLLSPFEQRSGQAIVVEKACMCVILDKAMTDSTLETPKTQSSPNSYVGKANYNVDEESKLSLDSSVTENQSTVQGHIDGIIKEKCTKAQGHIDGIVKEHHMTVIGQINGRTKENHTTAQGHIDGRIKEKCTKAQGHIDGIAKENPKTVQKQINESVKENCTTPHRHFDGRIEVYHTTAEAHIDNSVNEKHTYVQGHINDSVKENYIPVQGHIDSSIKENHIADHGHIDRSVMENHIAVQGHIDSSVKENHIPVQSHMVCSVKDNHIPLLGHIDSSVKDNHMTVQGHFNRSVNDNHIAVQGPVDSSVKKNHMTAPGNINRSVKQNHISVQGHIDGSVKENHIPVQGHIVGSVKENDMTIESHIDGSIKVNHTPVQSHIDGSVIDNHVPVQGHIDGNVKDNHIPVQGHIDNSVKENHITVQGHIDVNAKENHIPVQSRIDGSVKENHITVQGHIDDIVKDNHTPVQRPTSPLDEKWILQTTLNGEACSGSQIFDVDKSKDEMDEGEIKRSILERQIDEKEEEQKSQGEEKEGLEVVVEDQKKEIELLRKQIEELKKEGLKVVVEEQKKEIELSRKQIEELKEEKKAKEKKLIVLAKYDDKPTQKLRCSCGRKDCKLAQGDYSFKDLFSTILKQSSENHTENRLTDKEEDVPLEVIKTPGVLRDEKLKDGKDRNKKEKICSKGNLCKKCTGNWEKALETYLKDVHGDKKPCGQCETCLYARTIMLTYLGYETADESQDQYLGNQRLVFVIPHPDKPIPKMYLFKFHSTVSQANIDGQKVASTACAIIAMLFARKFTLDPTVFLEKPPIADVPDKVFDQVEESIREGNETHSVNFKGQPVNLGPEEVTLLTSHLNITLIEETDVDTRDLSTVVKHVMNLKPKQVILFIKNYKVVSIMPCNNNNWVLLFDSHPHFSKSYSTNTIEAFGTYIFYAKREKSMVEELFKSYDGFCDPIPFYGKFAIFQVKE